ncbi:ADP-ribosylation factor-like protein 13B isoform X2 [Sminthopsis crassicaudata]
MVGLHNAGKTAIARVVKGESSTDVVPTMGISRIDLRHENCDVTLFDLGGGKKTRETWKYYFGESYGLIFVVDSSNLNNIQASKEAIYEIVKHPRMMGKPVLILANKQDKEGALSEECLIKELALEQLATEQKCVCQIKTCSAMTGTGKKRDAKIICGFDWILGYIQNNYEKLKVQVERDTKTLEICWQNTERDNQMREPKKTENPEFII